MSWNYRIVQYEDGSGFGLHEVYYDEQGHPTSMTQRPCSFFSEDVRGLRDSMVLARGGVMHQPVVHERDILKKVKKRERK